MQYEATPWEVQGRYVSIPQAVWIACNMACSQKRSSLPRSFNTASGMDCMQYVQYDSAGYAYYVSIPQAVWIACNVVRIPPTGDVARWFQYRKRYGLHAMRRWHVRTLNGARFNTASGMDCMQYRPSQPLGQLNPEAGFLNGSLFLANRRNLAGFFCRQNRLKTSANPVISRKLLSTGKI